MASSLSQNLRRLLVSGDRLSLTTASLRSISTTSSAAMRYNIIRYDGPDEPEDKGGRPAVEIKESGECFIITRAVPGFGKESVKVGVDKEKNTVSIELRDSDCSKTVVPLPEDCKGGVVRAFVKHGMVMVVVPKLKN